MFQVLEQSKGNVLGIEISQEYTKEDVATFKKEFESMLAAGHDRINLLIKMDNLDLEKIKLSAFLEDSFYGLKYLHQLRHIAVVGDSKLKKAFVELDNKLLGKEEEERIEKYFDISDLNKAWEFVQS